MTDNVCESGIQEKVGAGAVSSGQNHRLASVIPAK